MGNSPRSTDATLGQQVQAYLKKKGVATPSVGNIQEKAFEDIKKAQIIIMKALGLDLTDDSLKETPRRVAKMFTQEVFWGVDVNNFPRITTVENKMRYDEMVVVDNISVKSFCEHHFVHIDGVAHIAYIPGKKVLGLSKFNRIVNYFSRRPQIQERLTEQVYYALEYVLGTPDIAVMIQANHFCVKARGVEDINSTTTTSKVGGIFLNAPVKSEFLSIINSRGL